MNRHTDSAWLTCSYARAAPLQRSPTRSVAQRFYLENVPWALGEGEFYHDAVAGKLYVWPPAGTETLLPTGAVAPVTDQLMEIRAPGQCPLPRTVRMPPLTRGRLCPPPLNEVAPCR